MVHHRHNSAPEIGMIWGQTPEGVIGAAGDIPWYVPEDFQHFKAATLGCPVIMGRATWDSLPEKNRPLPGRKNIVVTRNEAWAAAGADVAHSLTEALALAAATLEHSARLDGAAHESSNTIWIIGGQQLFTEGLSVAHRIERSIIDAEVDGDTFAPELGPNWRKTEIHGTEWLTSKNGTRYRFEQLRRDLTA